MPTQQFHNQSPHRAVIVTIIRLQGENDMDTAGDAKERVRIDPTTWGLATLVTLFFLFTAQGYGIFRDEMYYLACGEHLAWGYVDQPPLIALVAWLVSHTIGTSMVAIRAVPALCAGLMVLLTAQISAEFGGRRLAQWTSALAVVLAPIYLSLLTIFSMNAMDLAIWSAISLVLIRILRTGNSRLWLLFGALAGIGLENKVSVLFLCFGLTVGLLVTRQWRLALDRYLWMGAAIAVVIFAPHVLWQISHDWPTAEFIRNATADKNVAYAPMQFIGRQINMMNPVAFPLWLAGLVYLFIAQHLKAYRCFAWAYVAILALMTSQNAKPYYMAAIYPVLFAAGSAWVERLQSRPRLGWLGPAVLIIITLTGGLIAPLAKPLLPVDQYVAYAAALGEEPGTSERKQLDRLPQFFADMHGWQQLAETVAQVFHALPAEDQQLACIYAQNYGEAAAIDHFGPALGLPQAVAGHNSYWLWGPGPCQAQVLIIIGGRLEDHLNAFEEVGEAGFFDCQDCMPYEDEQIIWVARKPRADFGDIWQRVKHYD